MDFATADPATSRRSSVFLSRLLVVSSPRATTQTERVVLTFATVTTRLDSSRRCQRHRHRHRHRHRRKKNEIRGETCGKNQTGEMSPRAGGASSSRLCQAARTRSASKASAEPANSSIFSRRSGWQLLTPSPRYGCDCCTLVAHAAVSFAAL